MDLKKIKHVHFTGIKGVGNTALALCMRDMGKKVTGSDVAELFVTDEVLSQNNINWTVGFGAGNLQPRPDLVVTTAAHGGLSNPEVKKAQEIGIPTTTYAEFLADIANTKEVVGVCGVGGKTTTASMIACMLTEANLNPSYAIGVAKIYPLGYGGHFDPRGKHFVCEADDYVVSPGIDNTPKFMLLNPKVLVVTNIEYDHPDVYASFTETKRTFQKLFLKLPKTGLLVACVDNDNVSEAVKDLKRPIVTYGMGDKADWQIANVHFTAGKTCFSLINTKREIVLNDVEINVPGDFSVRNAAAAMLVGRFLGINDEKLRSAIASYLGCRRRFEKMGEFQGALFYDDYAHHPEEVKATLTAARQWFPKRRIIAIFQPHTYSRTKALFDEFSISFTQADAVGFMDIYASAREAKDSSVSSELLAKAAKDSTENSYYLGNHKNTLNWLAKNVQKGDVVLTLGAGDIFHLYNSLFNQR